MALNEPLAYNTAEPSRHAIKRNAAVSARNHVAHDPGAPRGGDASVRSIECGGVDVVHRAGENLLHATQRYRPSIRTRSDDVGSPCGKLRRNPLDIHSSSSSPPQAALRIVGNAAGGRGVSARWRLESERILVSLRVNTKVFALTPRILSPAVYACWGTSPRWAGTLGREIATPTLHHQPL